MSVSPSALLEPLTQWLSGIYLDPLGRVGDLWFDLQHLHLCLERPESWCYATVGICVLLFLLFLFVATCTYRLCTRSRKRISRQPLPPTPVEKIRKREVERRKKEKLLEDKEKKCIAESLAGELLDIYSEAGVQYSRDKPLPDMGSRLDKFWYRVTSQENYTCHILTIGSISSNFTCNLEVEGYINKQLSALHNPYLQDINEIKFLKKKSARQQVAIIQPYWEKGSLKDLIYKVAPFQEWSQKYNKIADSLPAKTVALYGGQILEAVVYLYGRGYNPLGHIQTGNIYIAGENSCRLGGHENTLLKYRARLYRTCDNLKCLDDMDIIMFGHVIYEMSAGKELTRLVPHEEDYRCVQDEGCVEILQYIFAKKENGRFKRGIIKIQGHWFFGGTGAEHSEAERAIQQRKSRLSMIKQKSSKLMHLSKH